jgi:hypothetical protein
VEEAVSTLLRAALREHRARKQHLLKGKVREVRQWHLEGQPVEYRYDFAWRDPASGLVSQYCSMTYVDDLMSEAERDERIVPACVAQITREIERACGMEYALKNQYQLSLPRGVPGRYV